METPRTLMEAVRFFGDEAVTFDLAKAMRWPGGVHCPECGRTDVRFIATRKIWECKEKHAKRQFSVKRGTIFEDSALPLDKWFVAIWSVTNCKNGISSYELARAVGVTQKSAWHMLHRIRLAMKAGDLGPMSGVVEADETYIGGKVQNMHAHKRPKGNRVANTKSIVFGVLERGTDKRKSQVRAKVVPNVQSPAIHEAVRENVAPGSTLYTDALRSYRALGGDFDHAFVDHAHSYVRDRVHTNGIENFWSLMKRTIKGTYVNVEPAHLGRYLDEQVFRFNERGGSDYDRFAKALSSVGGRRLQYKDLIADAHA